MPFPLRPPFVAVHVRLSALFYHLGAPHPADEHADQRKGKDVVPVPLCCTGQGILDSGLARCGLLCDSGRGGLGTSLWRIYRQRVLPAVQGNVHSETGAWNHLCCLADNQLFSILVGSSDRGCTESATDYPVPRGHRLSLMIWYPLSSGIQTFPTG